MTTLFISHSSKDKAWAERMHGALSDAGYQCLFLDSHPDDGIHAGADWERMLYQRLRQSRGVVVLCTARGEVAEALELAQGELGRFEEAVASLDRAVRADDAHASWNAIEQRARFQARWALELCRRRDDPARQQGLALFESASKSLAAIERDPEGKLTVERYRSLSGIHWRRVQTLPAGEREAELERLVSVFERAAADLNRGGTDPLDPYSRLLWLAGMLMLMAYSAKRLGDICPNFADWCAEIERRAPGYERELPSASAGAIALELRLIQLLEQGGLTESTADELIAGLQQILTRGASHRQLSSLLDYVELLRVLAQGATHKKNSFRVQVAPLARIADALRKWQADG